MPMELSVVEGRLKRAFLVEALVSVKLEYAQLCAEHLLHAEEMGRITVSSCVDLLWLMGQNEWRQNHAVSLTLKDEKYIPEIAACVAEHCTSLEVAREHLFKPKGMTNDQFLLRFGNSIVGALRTERITYLLKQQGVEMGVPIVSDEPFLTMLVPIQYATTDLVVWWIEIDAWSCHVLITDWDNNICHTEQYHDLEQTADLLRDFLFCSPLRNEFAR